MASSKVISRAALYELVWREPRTRLAKEFGVSDVALGKTCRAAGIPVPPPGYWAKKKAGKAPVAPPLPPREPGVSEQLTFGLSSYQVALWLTDDELRNAEPVPPVFAEPLESVRERIRPRLGKVSAPKSLNRPHRAIVRLLADDDIRREKLKGMSYVFDWDKPRFESPLEQRRLRILSAIFSALARFEAKPSVDRREAKDISLQVGDQDVSLTLEPTPQKPRANEATGKTRLTLTIKGRHWLAEGGSDITFADSDEGKLEAQLKAICEEILVAGERQYRENMWRRYHLAIERKQELEEEDRVRRETEARLERERIEKAAQERLQRLLDDAAAHEQAKQIRDYVEAVLAHLQRLGPAAATDQTAAWAEWARAQANAIDPITTARGLPAEFC